MSASTAASPQAAAASFSFSAQRACPRGSLRGFQTQSSLIASEVESRDWAVCPEALVVDEVSATMTDSEFTIAGAVMYQISHSGKVRGKACLSGALCAVFAFQPMTNYRSPDQYLRGYDVSEFNPSRDKCQTLHECSNCGEPPSSPLWMSARHTGGADHRVRERE